MLIGHLSFGTNTILFLNCLTPLNVSIFALHIRSCAQMIIWSKNKNFALLKWSFFLVQKEEGKLVF